MSQRVLVSQPAPNRANYPQLSKFGLHPEMLPRERGKRGHLSGRNPVEYKEMQQKTEGGCYQEGKADVPPDQPSYEVEKSGH